MISFPCHGVVQQSAPWTYLPGGSFWFVIIVVCDVCVRVAVGW